MKQDESEFIDEKKQTIPEISEVLDAIRIVKLFYLHRDDARNMSSLVDVVETNLEKHYLNRRSRQRKITEFIKKK